jgi:[CysO sulfur-carrier protein]-S-L-cysteine hydrolase
MGEGTEMIVLTQSHYNEILEYARKELPNEACGLLGGEIDAQGRKIIKKVYLLTNLDQSPEHFSMDPKEQFSIVKELRKQGWILIGNFHSHPSTPSRPSEEDKRLAYDPEASYFILSLMNQDESVLKSFKIQAKQVTEEEINIIA